MPQNNPIPDAELAELRLRANLWDIAAKLELEELAKLREGGE